MSTGLVVERRPELAHLGLEFVAYYRFREDTYGVGSCESAAIEDLHTMMEAKLELLADRAQRNGDGRGQCVGGAR